MGVTMDKKISVKEKIVEIIQSEGYDLFTACEMADNCIKEFMSSKDRKATYYVGKSSFTLIKKG